MKDLGRAAIFAGLLMSGASAHADALGDLASAKASALSVGALYLLSAINTRPEVQVGVIQTVSIFAESTGAIWVSAWPGSRSIGQTPAERCLFVLKTLREVLGSDGTSKLSTSLKLNVDTIVVGAGGTVSDDLSRTIAEKLVLRALVPLGDRIASCQTKALSADVVSIPKDDAGWHKPQ